jgi:hypothetical protein
MAMDVIKKRSGAGWIADVLFKAEKKRRRGRGGKGS